MKKTKTIIFISIWEFLKQANLERNKYNFKEYGIKYSV